jgi:hypothetical protein
MGQEEVCNSVSEREGFGFGFYEEEKRDNQERQQEITGSHKFAL